MTAWLTLGAATLLAAAVLDRLEEGTHGCDTNACLTAWA